MNTLTYTAKVANERHSYTQKMSATTRLQAEAQAAEDICRTRSDLPKISEISEQTGGKITATYSVKDQKWGEADGHAAQ